MAITLNAVRVGDVGFIDWLDAALETMGVARESAPSFAFDTYPRLADDSTSVLAANADSALGLEFRLVLEFPLA